MKSSANNEIRDYFKILKGDPSSRVFAPLAEALIRRGRLDEAGEICQMGLEANPDFSDGHLAYARVLYYLFRYQEALKQVKLTLGSTPNSVEAYLIAAEIFLARSQHKPASDACLKAIDIDPESVEARQILRRINSKADEEKSGQKAPRPKREPTSKFRATAGTAPSRRVQESNGSASPGDPFRQLLQETGKEGAGRLDRMEQPFSALSPGSYPSDNRDFGEASSDDRDLRVVPTEKDLDRPEDLLGDRPDERVMGLKKYRRDGTPAPQLPNHPPQPDDLLSEVPGSSEIPDTTDPDLPDAPHWLPPGSPATEPPPPSGLSGQTPEDPDLPSVDKVQALIDSYALRSQSETYNSLPVKMPRSGRLLVILFLLFSVSAIIGLILLGFGRDRRVQKAGSSPAAAASVPVSQPDEPIPLPKAEPEPPAPEPEKIEKAAVTPKAKPKRRKTSRRRKKRRKKRRRVKSKKKKTGRR